MRAQIRKDPAREDTWWVYTKAWWQLQWRCRTYVVGDDAALRAMRVANQFIEPLTIEVLRARREDVVSVRQRHILALSKALGHPKMVDVRDGETVEDALIEMAVARIMMLNAELCEVASC